MRLVVIGGTAAGLSAASRVRKYLPDADITVIERTGYVSYGSCGLPYYVSGVINEADELVSLTPADLVAKRGMKVLLHHEAVALDRVEKTVSVTDLRNGGKLLLPYDALVLATGASALTPSALAVKADNVFTLRTVENGIAIRQSLAGAKRAVIIGGGYIGLEMVDAFMAQGIHVDLFEAADRLLPDLNPKFSDSVLDTLKAHGVSLHLGATVEEILLQGGRAVGVKACQVEYPADIVLICVGVRPNASLAKAAGLATEPNGAITVDSHQRTSDRAIWACGDCACTTNRITGQRCYAPLGTNANKQGRVAGACISGKDAAFPGVLPSQITKVFELYIASTGLNIQQAAQAGFHAAHTLIHKGDRASYYPGGRESELCLVFDRASGRILGAQGIGGESIAGRINVLATAITCNMPVQDIAQLDLVYAPPVAPVYDPILIAGECAVKELGSK